jgi:hypothetical protein
MPGTEETLKKLHTPVIYLMGGEEDIAYQNSESDCRQIEGIPLFNANLDLGAVEFEDGQGQGVLPLLRSAPGLSGRFIEGRARVAARSGSGLCVPEYESESAVRRIGRGNFGGHGLLLDQFRQIRQPQRLRPPQVACVKRRQPLGEVLRPGASHRAGPQRRCAQGHGSVFCPATDTGGRSFCETGRGRRPPKALFQPAFLTRVP